MASAKTKNQFVFQRVRLWNPATKDTKTVFHIFNRHKPKVLVHSTTSLQAAIDLTNGQEVKP